MKVTHLILISLFLVIGWAYSESPLAFFAEIDDFLEPLSGTYYDLDGAELCILSHGNSWIPPIEFSLKANLAFTEDTSTPGYVGIYDGLLVFGPNASRISLDMDSESRVLNGPFSSCEILGSQFRAILYGYTSLPFDYCFSVEVYLLPYDRSTWSALKAAPVLKEKANSKSEEEWKYENNPYGIQVPKSCGILLPESYGLQILEDEEKPTPEPYGIQVSKSYGIQVSESYGIQVSESHGVQVPGSNGILVPKGSVTSLSSVYSLPVVFFVQLHGILVPLSGYFLKEDYANMSAFSHGDSSADSGKFILQDNYAFNYQKPSPGFVGFDGPLFGFGPTIPPTTLKLDNEKRLLNGPFYSCKMSGSQAHGILYRSNNRPFEFCFEVEIYLLPYNMATGLTVMDEPLLGELDKCIPGFDGEHMSEKSDEGWMKSLPEAQKSSSMVSSKFGALHSGNASALNISSSKSMIASFASISIAFASSSDVSASPSSLSDTDYSIYNPKEITQTITVCDQVAHQSLVTTTTATVMFTSITTFTVSGFNKL